MIKNIIIALIVIVLLAVGAYFLFFKTEAPSDTNTPNGQQTEAEGEPQAEVDDTKTVIGKSAEQRDIVAYHYGEGETDVLFVGGIHGGYEWNTSLVAYELMDYLQASPDVIPPNVRVTVIPVLNPDGLFKIVGTTNKFSKADVAEDTVPGRFNANNVDLNRNFDCDWKAEGTWQDKKVSGGASAFSEPESQAIKSYVEANEPDAVVVWYSSAGGVFASNCHNGVSTETQELTKTFADASGYKAYQSFNFYEITGDMVNWFAKMEIPAISILLTTHEDTEWSKNKAGVDALLKSYAE